MINAAKQGLARYLALYKQRRPHSSLARKMQDELYYECLPKQQNAAQAITGKTSLMKPDILFKQTERLRTTIHC